ncbi:ATP-grasp domain-containing protein [Clostridium magnum]|uniref:2-oxoglutarate carboxylase small subunit n=1 Tax=Clostridium magnum DSM 2767 TaxID=1121326 RepID=A0A162UA50_9CLOT|nr:ATP-grasp domain-containing protein [Clostridium magnum]KZL93690.1 2-oxoglutarate carboxylase small subunit [Clostridium magnum DSM 2767]SHI10223.1 Biotin carboxylase [Clostridium magnum DSM 2767]
MNLKGKKLLILGGTTLSCEIIRQAKEKGAYIIVTDYLEDSPGKKIADKSFMVSTTDVDGVVNLIKKEKINGILTGFIDSMLPYYQEICEKTDLPCYATKAQIEITTNKVKFKKLCNKFGVPVVEEYKINYPFKVEDIKNIKFPVLVKPIDNSGARGIHICENAEDLKINYEKALSFSSSKQVIIERYMTAKEVTIFYIIQDGEIYLSAMADRYTKNKQGGIIPLPVAYIFPSKHLKSYQESLNHKVIEMFKSIDIQNGMMFIQSFVEDGKCIFYEMGFRLTGSLEYKIIRQISGINPLEMMINYALAESMNKISIKPLVNPNFKECGCNITFLAKPGKVGRILGVDEVYSLEEVIDVVPAYNEGDVIQESDIGTLKQVIIRVLIVAENKDELAKVIDKIYNTIKVYSEDGENMLLETFDTKDLFN